MSKSLLTFFHQARVHTEYGAQVLERIEIARRQSNPRDLRPLAAVVAVVVGLCLVFAVPLACRVMDQFYQGGV